MGVPQESVSGPSCDPAQQCTGVKLQVYPDRRGLPPAQISAGRPREESIKAAHMCVYVCV